MCNEEKYGYTPKTEEELLKYLHDIENQGHNYSSVADALTKVTVAMFNYFAHKHGMTGFQASWSGLQFLKHTRGMEMPFMIIDGSKLMYPQYNLHKDLDNFIEDIKPELSKKAKENLENVSGFTSSNVIDHWEKLASYTD